MTNDNNDEAMLAARALVEDHIRHFGMVPHPDIIKASIAGAIRSAAKAAMGRAAEIAEREQRSLRNGGAINVAKSIARQCREGEFNAD